MGVLAMITAPPHYERRVYMVTGWHEPAVYIERLGTRYMSYGHWTLNGHWSLAGRKGLDMTGAALPTRLPLVGYRLGEDVRSTLGRVWF
jgi:hypothetical protein